MHPDLVAALTAGAGRGFTVIGTLAEPDVLIALTDAAGATGLVLALGPSPAAGGGWQAVCCVPAVSIPLRSHLVDAAVLSADQAFEEVAGEVRRVLAPGGDVRVLVRGAAGQAETALRAASIRPQRVVDFPALAASVVIARGP